MCVAWRAMAVPVVCCGRGQKGKAGKGFATNERGARRKLEWRCIRLGWRSSLGVSAQLRVAVQVRVSAQVGVWAGGGDSLACLVCVL